MPSGIPSSGADLNTSAAEACVLDSSTTRLTLASFQNRSVLGGRGVAKGIALCVDFAAEVFEDVVGHFEENLDDLGIELATRPCLDFGASLSESSGGTVRTVRDNGV